MDIISRVLMESWWMIQESSIYMIFGILVAGLLRVFLRPEAVSRHLGEGRFSSVFKAALIGIPLPLCSCGVLPAAASLKKQGANNGALTAFLISTPESDIDAIALTYALTDPIMTVARPVAGFATAVGAGIAENLLRHEKSGTKTPPDLTCPVDGCCDGIDCVPADHRKHHTAVEKLRAGLGFALKDLWNDIALWYFAGVLIAGIITVAVPQDLMVRYLGGGFYSMLIMLVAAIPFYICASASTPIAAALILKGVSPGAALVFLLAGPATNITSVTVLLKIMGRKATVVYVASIAVFTLASGLLLDEIYRFLGISAQAMIGTASEITPVWMEVAGALLLIGLSVRPFSAALRSLVMRLRGRTRIDSCGCGSALCSIEEIQVGTCGCSSGHTGIASHK
ncbi:MAG: permease [Desulfobacteraceae bacterium]|nr:MAG: permease [Desulfobacteraceae bacterium]